MTVVELEAVWYELPWPDITAPNDYYVSDPPGNTGPHRLGVRYFPDAAQPGGAWKDIVWLGVKTYPQVSGLTIYLKGLDPDDPSANTPGNVVDGDSVGPDNRDQAGGILDGGGLVQVRTLWTNAEQGFTATNFRVGHQPGDNHRVAVTLKESALHTVTDANVPPSGAVVRPATDEQPDQPTFFIGHVSPLLTVWRVLHVETDTMMRPTFSENTVDADWDDPVFDKGRFFLDVSNQDNDDNFENGFIRIRSIGSPDLVKRIISFTHRSLTDDFLELDVSPPEWGARLSQGSCTFSDDDLADEGNFLAGLVGSDIGLGDPASGGIIPLPDVEGLSAHYAPAYVLPSVETEHTSRNISFRRNIEDIESTEGWNFVLPFRGPSRSGDRYWHAYIYSAFQAERSEDFDGEQRATKGINTHREDLIGNTPPYSVFGPAYNGMCVIFVESIDDGFSNYELRITVAHEIAHTLGVDHTDGLMDEEAQTNVFGTRSLKELREYHGP